MGDNVNIRFLNRGPKVGEIWLYDQVGAGMFGGLSAKSFAENLRGLGKVDSINLRINSPGGYVFEGMAIYNTLKAHPAHIEVDIDGIAASIASVIAMAGDEVRMAANSMMMIHNPAGAAVGGADEMRKTADLLDQVKGLIVDTYANRTGQPSADLVAWMDAETWLTAAEAADLGFANSVTAEQKIAACYGFDLSSFKHAPKSLTLKNEGRPLRDMSAVRLNEMAKRIAR